MVDIVPLIRRFRPVPKDVEADEEGSIRNLWGLSKPTLWTDLHIEYRTVILADAGAGKTFEMESRASQLRSAGKQAFFLRIEAIDGDLAQAFEVGTAQQFAEWVAGDAEAWFFLDSVDEARLDDPKSFEAAIRNFSHRIHDAMHRAHVCISSRPYAWRPKLDREMIERLLPFDKQKLETTGENAIGDMAEDHPSELDEGGEVSDRQDDSALTVHWLCPLDRDDIRTYASHRNVADSDAMITAIERANLWSLAERPFDLDDLASSWNDGLPFSSRLDVLRRGIERRLQEIHPDRELRQPLAREKALEGARLLAAAVILSGQPGIRVPEGQFNNSGLDAAQLLPNWQPAEIQALLARGLFNDAIYGVVRIRHREVRELLAAEWFHDQLSKGGPRHKVETLIFGEQYGEQVIRPRLRPILPWLILFDPSVRAKALALHPEIAVEGGDAARLPLAERKKLLADMVEQIVNQEDDRNGRHNEAIARIAQADLADDAKDLVERHADNDDAIFFLGRLVWQGEMASSLPLLEKIACNQQRGVYARLASIRAIATIGSSSQREALWSQLAALPKPLERRLCAELLDAAPATSATVELLLSTLKILVPYKQFEATGLSQSLHAWVDRFGDTTDETVAANLLRLISGLNSLLDEEPHIERGECHVSQTNRWLMPIALHAAEKLVVGQSAAAFDPSVVAVLLKAPAVKFWSGSEIGDYKTRIEAVVPEWPDFNDALFWASIDEMRAALDRKKGERLIDDWPVTWLGHFWRLESSDFSRVVGWIESREAIDDRHVAVCRAFRIYATNDRPKGWLADLKRAVRNMAELEGQLANLLKPPKSKDAEKWKREDAQRKRRRREQKLKEAEYRAEFAAALKKAPDRVRNSGLEPGQLSNDQYWLLRLIEGEGLRRNRAQGSDWQALIAEFGDVVARAYRDAALSHWRAYNPGLRSEGTDTSSIPYALIFAMAGLAIESSENPDFSNALSEAEVRHALRYFVWELNGFPTWLERLFVAHAEATLEAIWTELKWELEACTEAETLHYVLHDLVYYTPWLHAHIAPHLIQWLTEHDAPNADSLRYALEILHGGGVEAARLAALAEAKLSSNCPAWQRPSWHALWADTEPQRGILSLTNELEAINDSDDASLFSQQFLVALMGERRSNGSSIGSFKTPEHLKTLYAVMHRYVRATEDIQRAGKGVYSPGLRDHAQDARNHLFKLLSDIPGKESYLALIALSLDHPDESYRHWMARNARDRAIEDADLPAWSAPRIREFANDLEITPQTHRELFNLGASRLLDFKAWLENGNDSLAATYQKVASETEMRNVVANWLNTHSANRYSCAQEAELANAQRPDIWLQNPMVTSPVPIELKLLDMDWSGPKLCERLRNQLAGDYLREQQAGCGIMLLVWQGSAASRQWDIEGDRVSIDDLAAAISKYWRSIAPGFPGVEAIEVIVIDLTTRSRKSET